MTDTTLGPGAEFDRIRAIAEALGAAGAGLGDDCAFLPDGWCVSIDVSTEQVHFRRDWLAPEEIGWRAAGAALSDLAAVGATAEAVLVGLSSDRAEPAATIASVMRGVGAAAQSVGARVVGGDLTAGPALSLAVTVLGRAARPIERRGARVGDGLWVTGALGGARAALLAWLDGREPNARARARFAHPMPRIEAGRRLAALGATAMIDVSDGLAGDAGHLAAASGVGLAIDVGAVPIDGGVATEAARRREPPAVLAASGGEDYELLVALPPSFDERTAGLPLPLTRVGEVVGEPGVKLMLGTERVTISGFDHFA